ncbi:MAG: MoxR family ATPase [Verrucomicrobiota bacterium]
MSQTSESIPAPRIRESLLKLQSNISKVIRGKDETIQDVIVSLIAGGHVLLEDLPGLGKTTLAYCLAQSIESKFSRIQFTSDLLPTDVLGVSIYDEQQKQFVFKKGPIFANIVLADEINRATPKTQSALLEVMDRGKVSVDGVTHAVGEPFIVFATQNPVDYEGTFPLPESQMDRFLMRLQMGYPDYEYELEILGADQSRRSYDSIEISPVLTQEQIFEIQQFVPQVYVEDSLLHYMLKFVTATRTESEFEAGVSTRGTLALKLGSQAKAICAGRAFVIPEDVTAVVKSVFTHRLALRRQTADPLEERRAVEGILTKLIDSIPLPI